MFNLINLYNKWLNPKYNPAKDDTEKCERLIDLYLKKNPSLTREQAEYFVQEHGLCIKLKRGNHEKKSL